MEYPARFPIRAAKPKVPRHHSRRSGPAWGSFRDLAVLLAEAVRALGFGARIVSGYLFDPQSDLVGSAGPGLTHAWTEIYVPGAGWTTFDPTNRSVGSKIHHCTSHFVQNPIPAQTSSSSKTS